jgi:hypothetical protein
MRSAGDRLGRSVTAWDQRGNIWNINAERHLEFWGTYCPTNLGPKGENLARICEEASSVGVQVGTAVELVR